ncbi:MAG: hypothetical protein K8R59_10900 [Thermoanaerobaculales bacterium]|nr:hypothetical protein [Thermoanaerobaculales bacterium]
MSTFLSTISTKADSKAACTEIAGALRETDRSTILFFCSHHHQGRRINEDGI